MASVLVWRPRMAARCSLAVARRAASAFLPKVAIMAAAALGRLRKRSEFLAVAATNRRWTTPGLVLQAKKLPPSDEALSAEPPVRLGFTATKKIGGAVVRNRAKRRLRAAAREVLTGVEARPADLVLVARQGTVARPYLDLKADLGAALGKLGILAQGPDRS